MYQAEDDAENVRCYQRAVKQEEEEEGRPFLSLPRNFCEGDLNALPSLQESPAAAG